MRCSVFCVGFRVLLLLNALTRDVPVGSSVIHEGSFLHRAYQSVGDRKPALEHAKGQTELSEVDLLKSRDWSPAPGSHYAAV